MAPSCHRRSRCSSSRARRASLMPYLGMCRSDQQDEGAHRGQHCLAAIVALSVGLCGPSIAPRCGVAKEEAQNHRDARIIIIIIIIIAPGATSCTRHGSRSRCSPRRAGGARCPGARHSRAASSFFLPFFLSAFLSFCLSFFSFFLSLLLLCGGGGGGGRRRRSYAAGDCATHGEVARPIHPHAATTSSPCFTGEFFTAVALAFSTYTAAVALSALHAALKVGARSSDECGTSRSDL